MTSHLVKQQCSFGLMIQLICFFQYFLSVKKVSKRHSPFNLVVCNTSIFRDCCATPFSGTLLWGLPDEVPGLEPSELHTQHFHAIRDYIPTIPQ